MFRRWVAGLGAVAVVASGLVGAIATATTAQAAPVSYPWSKVAAADDYLSDAYTDLGPGHVFENVTTDRLLDILSSDGNYYIALAGPEHASSQALLGVVNDAAKAQGITKIYHFDPYVDGYQLDATRANGVADVTGGTSTNFGGAAKLSDVWRLITQLLPGATVTSGALAGYAGDTAVLLNVKITNRKDVEAGKTVTKLAEVKAADASAFATDAGGVRTAARAGLDAAFAGQSSTERTQWQFFERLYNASATKTEGTTATADRIGAPVKIFDAADYPDPGRDFRLKSIDLKELYHLLNSSGEVPILFAGQGCHNTQAIIGSVAKRAKELSLPVVYVVDLALDSNVKFGTGELIDTASANSATGGLWVRSGSAVLSASAPYQYGYSYLYGKLADYFGPNWITENSSKKNNSVAYYPNAVLGETSTTNPYAATFNAASDKANATRLQVPTLVRYNKDAANPVVGHWLHKDNVAAGKDQTYTEYMLELGWVRQTEKALADTGRSTGRDGLTKVEFAAEAVAALDNVLKPNTSVQFSLTTTPAPTVAGTPVVGGKLEGFWDSFSQNPTLSYQWLADGVAIDGATADAYTPTAAELGKQISFRLTASRPNYASVAKLSEPTAAVAGAAFSSAPVPTITGTVKAGQTLTAVTGDWAPAATLSYQWRSDGKDIAGASTATYQIRPADVDARLSVVVTGEANGLASTSVTSAATAVVKGSAFTRAATPKITGKAKVGRTLKAKTGTWKPKAGIRFSYQWFAGGSAITGATRSSLKLSAADKGHKITVRVTGKVLGYNAVTKAAKATAKVK